MDPLQPVGEYGEVDKRCQSPEKARAADPPLTPINIPSPLFSRVQLLSPTSHRPPEVRFHLIRIVSQPQTRPKV